MTSWHSYPKIYNLGHSAISDLLQGDVVIEEKVDGSQLSFGMIDGVLKMRSKNVEFNFETGDVGGKMFAKAVAYVQSIQNLLVPGWTYRAEYLNSPAHNALTYDRTPHNNIIIFDVATGEETYLNPELKLQAAMTLGLECVPCYRIGQGFSYGDFKAFLDNTSVLGGQKIEGVVVKNYSQFGADKKILLGKYVSESFKEVHRKTWNQGEAKASSKEKVLLLAEQYRTPARWNKAIQHMRDAGTLKDGPQDIGPLLGEISKDIKAECEAEIKEQLFKLFWKDIAGIAIKGFPQWYKDELAKKQFSTESSVQTVSDESSPTSGTISSTAPVENASSTAGSTTAELGLQIRHL